MNKSNKAGMLFVAQFNAKPKRCAGGLLSLCVTFRLRDFALKKNLYEHNCIKPDTMPSNTKLLPAINLAAKAGFRKPPCECY